MGCTVSKNTDIPNSAIDDPLAQMQKELWDQENASLQTHINSLLAELQQREGHSNDLEQSIVRLTQECSELRNVASQLTEAQVALTMKDQIVAKLEIALAAAEDEVTCLRRTVADYEELKKRQELLTARLPELEEALATFKSKEVQWAHDKSELEQKVQALKLKQEVVRKAKRHYDSELSEKLVAAHIETHRLTDQVAGLSESHQTLSQKRTKALRLYVLTLLFAHTTSLQREAFLTWRRTDTPDSSISAEEGSEKATRLLRIANIPRSGMLYAFLAWKLAPRAPAGDTFSDSRSMSLVSAELDCSFSSEREESPTFGSNLFEKVLNLPPSRWGPAMNKLKVLQLLEELLDRKYELDLLSLSEHTSLRSFADCISDYFSSKFGLSRLATKDISMFLPGLSKLYREGNTLAALFCRITNILTDSPLPAKVSTFVVHGRGRFLSLFASLKRRSSTKGKEVVSVKKKSTEEELQLIDVIPLALEMFANDRTCGERFLMLLRPEKVLHSEYVCFLLCYDLTKQGSKPDSLFQKFDTGKKGWLSPSELAEGFESYLKIWVQRKDLEQAFTAVQPKSARYTPKDLAKMLKIDQFPMVRFSPVFSVGKTEFMIKLVATYTDMIDRHKVSVKETFLRHSTGGGNLSAAELSSALQELSGSEVHYSPDSEFTSLDQFITVVFDLNLGNLAIGPFTIASAESLVPPLSPLKSPGRVQFDSESPKYFRRSDTTALS